MEFLVYILIAVLCVAICGLSYYCYKVHKKLKSFENDIQGTIFYQSGEFWMSLNENVDKGILTKDFVVFELKIL